MQRTSKGIRLDQLPPACAILSPMRGNEFSPSGFRAAVLVAALLVAGFTASGGPRAQTPPPQVPCAGGETPFPAYAPADAPPAVAIWHGLDLAAAPCLGRLRGPVKTAVALAGSFRHGGSLDDLAARAGAISQTAGMIYWSTGEQKWRRLITEAWALTGPDVEARRQDFTAQEVRTPGLLHFAQNDTRSTGTNLYSLRTLESSPDRLVVEIVNESRIVFTVMRLFDAGALMALHIVERLDGDLWGYYALFATKDGAVEDYENSLINRAAAYQRFLLGRPGDDAPPLAP